MAEFDSARAGPHGAGAPKEGKEQGDSLPKTERWCTDVVCLVIFVLHWIAFVVVTFAGSQYGNPAKLYRPRDFSGGYCGIGDFSAAEKMVLMMNLSTTVEPVAKQLVCSTAAMEALGSLWGASSLEYAGYLCACCLVACENCTQSLVQPDLADPWALLSTIGGRMGELTSLSAGASLFSSSSANFGSFSAEDVWSNIGTYFVQVCLADACAVPSASNFSGFREHVYSPAGDLPWKTAWDALSNGTGAAAGIGSIISSSFILQALPESRCPYDARYCVAFPGVEFSEAVEGWCLPKPTREVSEALGQTAADNLESLGANSLGDVLSGEAGTLAETLDCLAVVSAWSFVAGLLFLLLLRFLVGVAVWGALASVALSLLAGGALLFAKSGQCAGAGLFDSGIWGPAQSWPGDEAMTGDGSDYVGYQTLTRSGTLCQEWAIGTPHSQPYQNASSFAGSPGSLADVRNYCRNPAAASTIWCFTVDTEKVWELCSPIGVLQPDCPSGYAVSSESNREAMKIVAYVLWTFAGIWLLLVWCLLQRIRLAIATSKVAALFVMHTPGIVLVPVVQVVVGICWCLIWCLCASFLMSQVPEDFVPTSVYATYREAAGTADTPGPCTGTWPAGFVWKDEENALCSSGQSVPRCWRCGLPRYVLGYKFAFAFFSFLWNSALGVALGQCVVAYSCAVWYFQEPHDRGGPKQSHGVQAAVRTCLRYHLGSLALGSFLVALVKFIRYVLMYLEKNAKAQKNKVMVMVFKCLQCCLWCFEKCIKFLNKNAYIQIAIHGTSFCTSAKNAFKLILANFLRFGVVAVLGSVLQLIGWVSIAGMTAGVGYLILQAVRPDVSPLLPTLSYLAVGYLVGKLFMAVFALAMDTSLQCFITDRYNPGAAERAPGPLQDMMSGKEARKNGDARGGHQQVAPS